MMNEAVELLSRYLQIDTINPPGNEARGAAFFADIFKKEKIDYKIYEAVPDRQSIRAVIPGSGEKGALILLNHIDVVPAQMDQWSFEPFSGEVKDGFVHGRGALDMKGQGIMELLAFLDIRRKGLTPCRDIIFLAVADEETGGKYGAEYLLDNHPDDFEADIVLNEGGYGITDIIPDRSVVTISTAEKGVCWVKLIRTGPPGHGSIPHGQNALEKMIQGINRILGRENPLIISDVMAEYFKQMGAGWDFLKPYLDDNEIGTLIRVLRESGLADLPQISAMIRNTVSVTMMAAGTKTNVIPSRVEAELDVRILPGQDPDEFVAELKRQLADEDISVEITTKHPANESPMDSSSFSLIKTVIAEHFPDALVVPSLLMAVSDSRFFRDRGISCYGVFPVLVQMDDFQRIHGLDEKISEENMIKGTEVYTDIVKKLCNL
jgi:acetylornithine deacetylase/succinyl-diaminopimelate desuccinylase-like protein